LLFLQKKYPWNPCPISWQTTVAFFKNLEFDFLRAFDRTRGGQKSRKSILLWLTLFPFAPGPVAMLVESLGRAPASPAPTQAVRQGRKEEKSPWPRPQAPLLPIDSVVTLPRHHVPNVTLAPLDMPTSRQSHALPLPQPTRTVCWPPLDTACAPSPAYKRAPCWPEKMHTTTLSLLDILFSLVARRFELAGVDRAPGRPRVPGVPEPPSSCRQYKVEEEEILRRSATPRRLPCLPRRATPPRPSSPSVSSAPRLSRRRRLVLFRLIRSWQLGPAVRPVSYFFSVATRQPSV
jgi:hypothetical protein